MTSVTNSTRVESDATQALWLDFISTRSEETRNLLIERYLPLVQGQAMRLVGRLPPHIEADDLRSAGVFGLVNAIEHYDPFRGVKFSTYCRKRILGAMLDELRRQDWLPREARERAEHLLATVELLRTRLGREPSDREIAREMDCDVHELREILHDLAFATQIPLELAASATRPQRSFEPVDDDNPEPPELVHRQELIQLVLRYLDPRELALVQSYYHDEQTMKRIGSRMRVTESRVCQMHTRMLDRLKQRLHEEVAP